MQANDDHNIFLSTAPPGRRDRIAALTVIAASAAAFVVTVPFAKVQLASVPALIAGNQSALTINDFVTAVLLFSQFALLRSRALLFLACGYLFTAVAVLLHTLAFLGLFTATDPLGAGPQSVARLYVIWHLGFPLFAMAYALSKSDGSGDRVGGSAMSAILRSGAAVLIMLAILTWLLVAWHDRLPVLTVGDKSIPSLIFVISMIALLTVATLLVLWIRRPHSVLDIWLMVALIAGLLDIALTTIFNATRFDLGYYAGRLYGLCAASVVLAVLLVDNVGLQVKLSRLLQQLRERHSERERLFSAVVESSNDAILTMTLDGVVTSWNRAAEQLFRYSGAEAVGRHISLIVPLERHVEVDSILAKIRRNEIDRATRDGPTAQGRAAARGLIDHLADSCSERNGHRGLQGGARHHREQADAARAQSRDRGTAARFRDLAGSHPGH